MSRTELKPYQRASVRRIEEWGGRALVTLEQGLGKTIVNLSFMARNPDLTPTIVVCPANVKYVWEQQAVEHARRRAVVCEGQKPPKISKRLSSDATLYVINFDILDYWVKWLRSLNPQLVIIDESQALANRGTRRTKAVRRLCAGVPSVIANSGTPLLNRPRELWPTLNIVRPDLYPDFFSFAQRHCNPQKKPWGWEYNGATNLDELHANLSANMMIRYRKSDVMQELPPKVREVVPMSLSDPAEYRKACDDFLTWLRQQDAARYDTARKAEAMTKIGYLLRLLAKLKLPAVVDWANNFIENTDEKLVLFAYHRDMVGELANRCNTKSVVIDGSVTGRARATAVEQFQKDPRTRLSINNLHAGGVGITLTAASTVAFAEMWWRSGDFLQAEDRLHRIGQKGTVFVNYLITPGTVEDDLCRIVQKKQEVISKTLDGGATADDLDVFNLLMKKLKNTL